MSEYEDLTELQKKLYDNLIDKEGAYNNISPIFKEASKEDLLAILDVAKDNNMLEKVLTTPNIIRSPYGEEGTLTLLGCAIYFNNSEENIKAILDVAKDNNMLEKVLTTPNIIKSPDGKERTLTPLGCATSFGDSEENIKAILDVAKDNNMLEKVLTKIENSDKYPQKDTVKTINRSIMIGSVCGVIAALAVGGGLFAAGVELPILALIGIAVAAALVIGVIAGGITYSVSKPSDKLDKPDLEIAGQKVGEAI